MNKKTIIFKANKIWLSKDSKSTPKPILKSIPEWYRKADRYLKNDKTNEFYIGPDGGRLPNWKACPAIFDIMGSGYSLNTPCDIEFYKKNGLIDVSVKDIKYSFFIQKRAEMPDFFSPPGYQKEHFNWFGDWQIKLPDGYSALYSNPFNRYDLPFLTVSGIVDNDKVHLPGSYPFFIRNDYTGIIPAGTPYMQIFPFKRDSWISEIIEEDSHSILEKESIENSLKYRVPNGGVYKNNVWEPRTYE